MTWTYNSANVGSSSRSFVRFKLGDTSSGNPLLQDEEIDGILGDLGDQYFAAAYCARSVAASFMTRVDKSVGKLNIHSAQVAEAYEKLATRLEYEASMRVTPYAGAISVSDKEANVADSDTVLPQFTVGQFDLPGVGVSSSSEMDAA